MTLAEGCDRGDQLGERCPQGDHGQPDHGVRNAESLGDQGAVVDQEIRSDRDGRCADDEHPDHDRHALFFCFTLFGGCRRFGIVFHLQEQNDHVDDKTDDQDDALPSGELSGRICDRRVENGCRKEESCRKQQTFSFYEGRFDRYGNSGDQACVADDGADGVSVGDAAAAFQGCLARDHDFRQGRSDGDDRGADQEFRQMEVFGDACGAVHEPVAAFDQQT